MEVWRVRKMSAQVFESPFQWNLYSSNGRSSFSGTIKRELRLDSEEILLAEISVKGRWIDRAEREISFIELSDEYHVTLSQVLLQKQSVRQLVSQLAGWLGSPTPGPIEVSSAVQDQHLDIYIGPSRWTKILPDVRLELRYSSMEFESGVWSFPIDQSCIRIFFDELSAVVSASE
jgi:hypothetical protein